MPRLRAKLSSPLLVLPTELGILLERHGDVGGNHLAAPFGRVLAEVDQLPVRDNKESLRGGSLLSQERYGLGVSEGQSFIELNRNTGSERADGSKGSAGDEKAIGLARSLCFPSRKSMAH